MPHDLTRPCSRCGGPKGPGRGHRYCAECKRETTSRKCLTCGTMRPAIGYRSATARRCIQCDLTLPKRKCEICAKPVGHANKKNVTCKEPACVAAARTRALQISWEQRTAMVAARTSRRCPGCGITKPLTREFWSPGGRDFPSTQFDSYCLPCRNAIQTDRRRQRRGWASVARERIGSGSRPDSRAFPALPAESLHHTIMRLAARHPDGLLGYCNAIGITDRDVRAWKGERTSVQFDVADRALTNMGLSWWDVWEPGTPEGRIAASAFEGTESMGAVA